MTRNILIDLGKLKNLNVGLGQVSLNFGNQICKIKNSDFSWFFLVPGAFVNFFEKNNNYEILSLKRRYLPSLCKKYDLWHAIHQDSAYFPSDKKTPYILTIHDLNFLEEKSKVKARLRLAMLQKKVNRANAITFVSKYSKKVAKEKLNISKNKPTFVIFNGVTILDQQSKKPTFLPGKKFLFSLGVIKEKKNFMVLLNLLKILDGYNLVIAGDKSDEYARKIEKKIIELSLSGKVILPGKISEQEKGYLFKNCEAFVFPSKFEGFGLPVIEAMRYGKPVFLSACSSLPEIGGKLAYYWEDFNPVKMKDIFQKKMKEYNANKVDLEKKIIEYSNKFSWEENVKSYINLYKRFIL